MNKDRQTNAPKLSSLAPRELEVLALAASGLSDKQISKELQISLNTLRTYWARIKFKSGHPSRQALVIAYIDLRLKALGYKLTVSDIVRIEPGHVADVDDEANCKRIEEIIHRAC